MLIRDKPTKTHSPIVSVTSTDIQLVQWLAAYADAGSICPKPAKSEAHSDASVWKVVGRDGLAFLRRVEPYMVLEKKRRRAQLLLAEYIDVTPRNGKYTPAMLARKEDLVRRFKEC